MRAPVGGCVLAWSRLHQPVLAGLKVDAEALREPFDSGFHASQRLRHVLVQATLRCPSRTFSPPRKSASGVRRQQRASSGSVSVMPVSYTHLTLPTNRE